MVDFVIKSFQLIHDFFLCTIRPRIVRYVLIGKSGWVSSLWRGDLFVSASLVVVPAISTHRFSFITFCLPITTSIAGLSSVLEPYSNSNKMYIPAAPEYSSSVLVPSSPSPVEHRKAPRCMATALFRQASHCSHPCVLEAEDDGLDHEASTSVIHVPCRWSTLRAVRRRQ